MIRFFTEFILSQKPRPFTSFRVTRRRVQNDNHPNFRIATQAPKGEGNLLGIGVALSGLLKCLAL